MSIKLTESFLEDGSLNVFEVLHQKYVSVVIKDIFKSLITPLILLFFPW